MEAVLSATVQNLSEHCLQMDRVKRIWYLSPMRAAKVQARLRIRAVSPEPSLLSHTSSESRGPFRQNARSLAPLNGWECAVKICHDGMLEDTNSHDGAQIVSHQRKPHLRLLGKANLIIIIKRKSEGIKLLKRQLESKEISVKIIQ